MAFYKPIILTHQKNPIIIYPEEGIENLVDEEGKALLPRDQKDCIKNVYDSYEIRYTGDNNYIISFLWNNDGQLFSDVWKFNQGWGSGPLSETYIYNPKSPSFKEAQHNVWKMGSGSGNTLIVLGREEEARRSLEYLSKIDDETLTGEDLVNATMQRYVDPIFRPELPFDLSNDTEYFL